MKRLTDDPDQVFGSEHLNLASETTMKRLTDEQRALVERHMPMLKHVVKRAARCWAHQREDLLSHLALQLCGAAASFDPSLGVRFITYSYASLLREAKREYAKQLTNGFTGLRSADGRFTPVPVAHLSAIKPSPGTGSDFAYSIPSRYDLDTWFVNGAPFQQPRSQVNRTLPAGVRFVKSRCYQARVNIGPPSQQISLGTFPASRYGSLDRAALAAGRAIEAFTDFYDPDTPGRDLDATFAHLKREGLIPQRVQVPRPRPRTKLAA
ncbi:sigma factor [Gemmata sp. SH-PL17]|uniref:sigma factor n=1 Tax=Gemmata sp. SH-PL17 TaxID=1630693 RepID=UPI0009ED242D|nr:sigma factor [Gemmata sp. SH-PL17]